MGEVSGAVQRRPILLYLHIPKAGGTTLATCIHNQLGAGDRNSSEEHPDQPGKYLLQYGIYYYPRGFFENPEPRIAPYVRRALAREDLRAVAGHFWFGLHEHLEGPWAYITMLRDPVHRVISLYAHLAETALARNEFHADMSFQDFVNDPPLRGVDNDQTRRISGGDQELGQCTRAMLDRAKNNLRRHFRVVGVTERFDETLLLLKHEFGWTGSLRYYPLNQRRKRFATSALPPDTIEVIKGRNELDLELYRFAHVLLDEAVEARGFAFGDELTSFQASQQKWFTELAAQQAELQEAEQTPAEVGE